MSYKNARAACLFCQNLSRVAAVATAFPWRRVFRHSHHNSYQARYSGLKCTNARLPVATEGAVNPLLCLPNNARSHPPPKPPGQRHHTTKRGAFSGRGSPKKPRTEGSHRKLQRPLSPASQKNHHKKSREPSERRVTGRIVPKTMPGLFTFLNGLRHPLYEASRCLPSR